jgi:hypothetical protein
LCEAFDQLWQEDIPQETFNNTRATRQNELHHANLAGKGGLQLDFSAVKQEKEDQLSLVAQKPATTWDLDDSQSWLLEESRSISLQWIQDRKNGMSGIPDGAQE